MDPGKLNGNGIQNNLKQFKTVYKQYFPRAFKGSTYIGSQSVYSFQNFLL